MYLQVKEESKFSNWEKYYVKLMRDETFIIKRHLKKKYLLLIDLWKIARHLLLPSGKTNWKIEFERDILNIF